MAQSQTRRPRDLLRPFGGGHRIAQTSIRWSDEAAGISHGSHDDAARCRSARCRRFLPTSSSLDLEPARRQARRYAHAVPSGESAAGERRGLAWLCPAKGHVPAPSATCAWICQESNSASWPLNSERKWSGFSTNRRLASTPQLNRTHRYVLRCKTSSFP